MSRQKPPRRGGRDARRLSPVIQGDRTGCGIAGVAAIVGRSYVAVKRTAADLGIRVDDPRLWSDTCFVRRLLAQYNVQVAQRPRPFRSWASLPDCALLAIKWHLEGGRPAWHWVVFTREAGVATVLDSKRSLRNHRRSDFGRMKPKWYLSLGTF